MSGSQGNNGMVQTTTTSSKKVEILMACKSMNMESETTYGLEREAVSSVAIAAENHLSAARKREVRRLTRRMT